MSSFTFNNSEQKSAKKITEKQFRLTNASKIGCKVETPTT